VAAIGEAVDALRTHRDDVSPIAMFIAELQIEDARVKHREWLLPDAQVTYQIWQPMAEL
jgi:hypothetical protein